MPGATTRRAAFPQDAEKRASPSPLGRALSENLQRSFSSHTPELTRAFDNVVTSEGGIFTRAMLSTSTYGSRANYSKEACMSKFERLCQRTTMPLGIRSRVFPPSIMRRMRAWLPLAPAA